AMTPSSGWMPGIWMTASSPLPTSAVNDVPCVSISVTSGLWLAINTGHGRVVPSWRFLRSILSIRGLTPAGGGSNPVGDGLNGRGWRGWVGQVSGLVRLRARQLAVARDPERDGGEVEQ